MVSATFITQSTFLMAVLGGTSPEEMSYFLHERKRAIASIVPFIFLNTIRFPKRMAFLRNNDNFACNIQRRCNNNNSKNV